MKICANGHLGQSKKCGVCAKPADMQFGKLVGPPMLHPNGKRPATAREIRS